MSIVLPDVIFRGYEDPNGAEPNVIVITKPDSTVIGTVEHAVKHSPSGMAWGYEGDGAADCARSLLLAAVDGKAPCPECAGTQTGDAEGNLARCHACEDGTAIGPAIYQTFKRQFVATWADGWTASRKMILAWLAVTYPQVAWPTAE